MIKTATPLLILALLASPIHAQPTVQSSAWLDLAKRQPVTTNALMAIDAEAMLQSKIALQNDWQELQAESFGRNPTLLPPQAKRFLLGSELNLEFLEPLRELAIIETSQPITLEQIDAEVGGTPDRIDGHAALVTKSGSYIIPYDTNHIAVYRLGTRQWVAQQMRAGQRRTESVLAPILGDALNQVERGVSQIVIALDLRDAVPRSEFIDLIQSTIAISGGAVSLDPAQIGALADDLATLEGIVFSVSFDDSIHGRLELAFHNKVTMARGIGKAFLANGDGVGERFLLTWIERAGASLPEFSQWEPTTSDKRVGIAGELSIAGLRRVLSLLDVDTPPIDQTAPAAGLSVPEPSASLRLDPERLAARRTADYARRITRLTEAIVGAAQGRSLQQQVLWINRSARTIARMPTEHVNYDVAAIGQRISYRMYEIASIYEDAETTIRYRVDNENPPPIQWHTDILPYRSFVTPYGRFYRYRPFSYAHNNLPGNLVRSQQIAVEELAKANAKASEVLAAIESDVMRMNQMIQ